MAAQPRPKLPSQPGVALDIDAVVRAHGPQITRWAARLGGPQQDLEDVVQEVLCVVARRLPELREHAKLRSWLYRITENVVRSQRRRVRWRRWVLGSSDDVAEGVTSPYPSPLEAVQRRQAQQKVYRVLDAMSETSRAALIWFELEGLSGPEIAELTGVSVGAVWVRLHRARKQFLKHLARIESEDGR